MLTTAIAAGAAFVKWVAIPTVILFTGQEAWDDWTYEDRVTACVEQVESITDNPDFIREAELNCRKSLR